MKNNILFLFLTCLISSGCFVEMNPSELVRYVQDETKGFRRIVSIGDMHLDAQYKPVSYLIAMDKRSNDISSEFYEKKKDELEEQHYFNLKLNIPDNPYANVENVGINNRSQQEARVKYLAFDMKDDLSLVVGNDTLNTALYHFERSYNVSSQRSFVFSFPKFDAHNGKDKILIFGSPYFNTGKVKFLFKEEDLIDLPKIKLM